jgi:hypothetical protein
MLRQWLFVLALAAASLSTSPAPAQPPVPAERSEAARAAAGRLVRLFLVDSGVIPYALERVTTDQLPAMRREILESDYMHRLPRSRREAVAGYLANLPAVIAQEFEPLFPAMVANGEVITLKLFSDEEALAIATFFDTPQMRSLVTDLIRQGVDAELAGDPGELTPDMTLEQTAAFNRFSMTPAGRAFEAKAERWFEALGAAMEASLGGAGPALTQRVLADLCRLLETDCPVELRSALAPA